jgi:hypothetical protein
MEKRELPDKFKNISGEIPQWFAYECMNCGTVILLQPFVMVKQVAKS